MQTPDVFVYAGRRYSRQIFSGPIRGTFANEMNNLEMKNSSIITKCEQACGFTGLNSVLRNLTLYAYLDFIFNKSIFNQESYTIWPKFV